MNEGKMHRGEGNVIDIGLSGWSEVTTGYDSDLIQTGFLVTLNLKEVAPVYVVSQIIRKSRGQNEFTIYRYLGGPNFGFTKIRPGTKIFSHPPLPIEKLWSA